MRQDERLSDEQLNCLSAAAERGMRRGRTSFGEVACDYLQRSVAELRERRAKDADLRIWIARTMGSGEFGCEVCPLDYGARCEIEPEPSQCTAALLAHFNLPEVPDAK